MINSGAFFDYPNISRGGATTHTYGYIDGASWKFDASRSNSIYGASTTVHPPSVTVRYFIKAA